jgi:hypothetical protein
MTRLKYITEMEKICVAISLDKINPIVGLIANMKEKPSL